MKRLDSDPCFVNREKKSYRIDKSASIEVAEVEFPSFEFTKTDPQKSPLGTNREITQPPPEDAENNSVFLRAQKWKRLTIRRTIIQSKESIFCHRGIAPVISKGGINTSRPSVDVMKSKNERFSYRGLFTCGNIWQCSVCASKISEKRRIELNQALKVSDEKGLTVIHGAFTAPHHLGESLHDLIGQMCHAKRLMQNRKPWMRLSKMLGMIGHIRALEVTFSWDNGWHVHFHVLLFLKHKFRPETRKADLMNVQNMIYEMWKSACETAGLKPPSREHGVILNDHADDYVGKWGSEHEMTKAHIKKGHMGGMTPFQFLDEYGAGDDRFKAIFLEYAKEFKGKKQLVWSRGLREYLEIDPEMTDEEISNFEDPDDEPFAKISPEIWIEVAKREKMGELLEICRNGEQALFEYLKKFTGKNNESRS